MLRSELRDLQSSQKINNFILVIKTNLIVMDPQYSQTIFKYFQSQYLRSTSSRICYYYFLISNFNVNFPLDFPSFIRSNSVWRDKLQIQLVSIVDNLFHAWRYLNCPIVFIVLLWIQYVHTDYIPEWHLSLADRFLNDAVHVCTE